MKQKRFTQLRTLLFALVIALSAANIPALSPVTDSTVVVTAEAKDKFSLSNVPKYKDQAFVEIHGNKDNETALIFVSKKGYLEKLSKYYEEGFARQ